MAKIKTPKDLLEEAKNVMAEARKKQAALMQEARELEEKKFAELGRKCIEFLESKITKEALGTFAKQNALIEIDSKKEDEGTVDV